MIELIMRPKKAERRPWEMFFIGLFWASASLLLVTVVFGKDSILKEGSGLLVVIFTVISCLPFMYYIIKLEEGKDIEINDSGVLIKEHSKAIRALMWLFLGFVVAFAFWYIVLPLTFTPASFIVTGLLPLVFYLVTSKEIEIKNSLLIVTVSFGILFVFWGLMFLAGSSPLTIGGDSGQNFNFQIKTFCAINSPSHYNYCLEEHGIPIATGSVSGTSAFLSIFANNIYVLIFTILFSLAFGAGAIFILVWNASVIAAAIGIFSKGKLSGLGLGLLRYMVHGIPEISAYFVGALAGGIVSVAVIRRDLQGEGMWKILQDSLLMIIIAIVILVISGLMEVYLTPLLF